MDVQFTRARAKLSVVRNLFFFPRDGRCDLWSSDSCMCLDGGHKSPFFVQNHSTKMRKIIDCSLPPTFMSVFDRHVSADAHQWQYSKTSSSFYVAIDYVDFQCHCHFHHPSFHSVLSQWLFLDLGIMGMSSVNNPRMGFVRGERDPWQNMVPGTNRTQYDVMIYLFQYPFS